MAKVIAVTSGKGGVGKTNIATNLGLALTARNSKVCIFDADTGLANINILLGIYPEYTLEQVLAGEKNMMDITVTLPSGLSIIPAASGISSCSNLHSEQLSLLSQALRELENNYDYILIDTAAGVDSNVLEFVASAHHKLIVITPEPTSLTDSFALLKLLSIRGSANSIFVVVNMVKDYPASRKIFQRFQAAVKKFLQLEVFYLGYLIKDPEVGVAVSSQMPVVTFSPECPVSCCFFSLADVLKSQLSGPHNKHFFSHYWQQNLTVHPKQSADPAKQIDFDSYQKTGKQLIALIEQDNINAQQAASLIKPLLKAYLHKIPKTSEVLFPAIYNFFAEKGYPEAEIKELIFTLESVYERAHGKPLRNTNHLIARILADVHGSEKKIRLLQKTLEKTYHRRFKKHLYDPVAQTIALILHKDFSKKDFTELMARFKQAYRQQFNAEFTEDSDNLIAAIKHLLETFPGQRKL